MLEVTGRIHAAARADPRAIANEVHEPVDTRLQ